MTVTKPKSIEDGDFVELSYTARVADTGHVVDTTEPGVAAEADIADLTATGPTTVIVGSNHLFESVEEQIKEVGIGGSGNVTVDPSETFGQIDPTATEIIDVEHIPEDRRTPGSWVQYKGEAGFVETIDDDRAKVNFNHPLAESKLEYEFTVHGRVTDSEAKCDGVLRLYDLDDVVTLHIEPEGDTEVLRLEVTDPRQAIEDWKQRKQDFLSTLQAHLPFDAIQVQETYST
jgi:FKBP-type peptidyl-prolyl cis-trans isomerase SlyD